MPNTKKDFKDKDFKCKRCNAHLATEKLDRQILVVGRLAIFNFASIVCMSCQALNLWQSPNLLPTKNENLLNRFPDKASDLPKPEKRIMNQLGIRGVTRTPNGKFKVRVIIDGKTRYLGCYDSIGAASKAYEKAKNGSDLSTKNRNDFYKQSENQNS
jgi:ribosomal protein L40E